jgi:serine/threonine protein phosphatase Stp1
VLSLRPVLVIFVAAIIGTGALYAGLPLEAALLEANGKQWLPWMKDGAELLVIFPLMIFGALIVGRMTSINPLALGKSPFRNATLGLGLGVAMVGIGVFASLASGNASIVKGQASLAVPIAIWAATGIIFIQSAAEEILCRGWVQPLVTRYWGAAAGIIATAALFTGLHNVFAINPPLVNFNLFLGGLIFGMLYRLFGGIAAPVLFHFGWNWSDAILFGLTPNPGTLSFGSIFDIDFGGPAQLGGVEEGLMASIFATLLLGLIAATLILLLRRGWHLSPDAKQPPASSPKPAAVTDVPAEEASQDRDKQETLLMSPEEMPDLPPATPIPVADVATGGRVQSATHEGCVRKINEDRFLVNEPANLYVVADGMGGHKFGDRASTMIVEHVERVDISLPFDARVEAVTSAILEANSAIHAEAQTNGSRMGSTVVAMLLDNLDYAVVWAGDSRAYRWRNGDVERLTKDHTQVQDMVDRGLLKPEDVARHPMSHVLVRAVGVNLDFELDLVRGSVEPGDVYFLCSDGIYDVLEEDEIGALLAKATVSAAMDKMIAMSLDLGARDNVTGIIVVPEVAA